MEITATVDRIEGELAVLLLRGDEKVKFNLPVVFLAGIYEGDVVNIAITKDVVATDEAKGRVRFCVVNTVALSLKRHLYPVIPVPVVVSKNCTFSGDFPLRGVLA